MDVSCGICFHLHLIKMSTRIVYRLRALQMININDQQTHKVNKQTNKQTNGKHKQMAKSTWKIVVWNISSETTGMDAELENCYELALYFQI